MKASGSLGAIKSVAKAGRVEIDWDTGLQEVRHVDQIELYVHTAPPQEAISPSCAVPACGGLIHCYSIMIGKNVCLKHKEICLEHQWRS